MKPVKNYIISVSQGTGCYRHIRISGDETLFDLHEAILDAFEFFDDHAHAFFMNNRAWDESQAYYADFIEDEENFTTDVTLDELKLAPGKKFLYIFDFGEEWRFQCRVLKVTDTGEGGAEIVRSVGESPDQYPDYEDEDWDEDEEDDDEP